MLTIKIEQYMANELEFLAGRKGISTLDLVSEALASYIKTERIKLSAYELGKDLFGVGECAKPDLGTNVKENFKVHLRKKHNH
jgi:hypothetical protein